MDHPADDHSSGALAPASMVVAAGRPVRAPGAPVNTDITLSSTYVADGEVVYARAGNPTWTAFEEALGALEGGQALLFASGMAAIGAVFGLAPPGGRVLAPRTAYNGTLGLLGEFTESGRMRVDTVDIADTAAVLAAIGTDHPAPDLVWVESPTNPLLEVADLPAVVAAAHERGARVVVDNTFATPLLARPLAEGADVVVHSVTKYLAGHSDVVLGAAVTPATDAGRADRERLERTRLLGGAIAGPHEAWLALRGLRTLQVRLDRACANAAALAERLGTHPGVTSVRYPGFGAMVSITVGDAERAERVAAAVRLWTHATSLGGVESLLERRRRVPGEPESVPVDLLRLSVGIEDLEDLWRDLDAALRTA